MSENDKLKAEALQDFANVLMAAKTLEEARIVAHMLMQRMLDIIYPSDPADLREYLKDRGDSSCAGTAK